MKFSKLLLLCMVFVQCSQFYFIEESKAVSIIDVQIIPVIPTNHDPISIYSEGRLAYWDSTFNHSDFSVNNNILQLDIFYDRGFMPASGYWNYTEEIGKLDVGIYDLTVNVFEGDILPSTDTYVTTFEVVPEPMSLVLLSVGALALRFRKN